MPRKIPYTEHLAGYFREKRAVFQIFPSRGIEPAGFSPVLLRIHPVVIFSTPSKLKFVSDSPACAVFSLTLGIPRRESCLFVSVPATSMDTQAGSPCTQTRQAAPFDVHLHVPNPRACFNGFCSSPPKGPQHARSGVCLLSFCLLLLRGIVSSVHKAARRKEARPGPRSVFSLTLVLSCLVY